MPMKEKEVRGWASKMVRQAVGVVGGANDKLTLAVDPLSLHEVRREGHGPGVRRVKVSGKLGGREVQGTVSVCWEPRPDDKCSFASGVVDARVGGKKVMVIFNRDLGVVSRVTTDAVAS